ncbi:MAG: permease-like cell division protein FtsX [Candidatus Peribacteraceae bacterium]|nr:permease-like cell division protein FtsX [Candidatus Peribacteraceae bacterium]
MLQLDPSVPILLKRGMRRGLLNLWREPGWGATSGSFLGIFIILQLLLLALLGVEGTQSLLRKQTDLRLEIRSEATRGETQQFFSVIQQLPEVEEAVFTTREQSYAGAQEQDPQLIAFLEKFHLGNPFNDTINITLRELDDYAAFSTFLEQSQWQRIVDPTFLSKTTNQEQRIHDLLSVTRSAKTLTYLLLILAGAVLLSITVELTRRNAISRAEEVLVERLVGAHTLSIFAPFAAEATALLWGSILVSTAAVAGLTVALPLLIPALRDGSALGELKQAVSPLLSTSLPLYFLMELLLAPLIAGLGSWLGMRSTVQSPRLSLARP